MKRFLWAWFLLCCVFWPFIAEGQQSGSQDSQKSGPKQDTSFAIDNFQPVPGPTNYITVDGATVGKGLQPTAGFFVDYQHKPFVIYNTDENKNVTNEAVVVVQSYVSADFMASLSFLEHGEVGLIFPLLIYENGHNYEIRNNSLFEGSSTSQSGKIQDLRLYLKAHIIKLGPVGLGVAVIPTLPIGHWAGQDNKFGGDGFLTVVPKALVDLDLGDFALAVNLGANVREQSKFFSTSVGSQMTYGVAGRYRFTQDISALIELFGATGFSSDVDENPLEALAAGDFIIAKDYHIMAGIGPGIMGGAGVPQFVAFVGFNWIPVGEEKAEMFDPNDRDGDGIPNKLDKCPDEPEDFDNFQDDDGCPDPDNDHDGVPDGYDACPNEPEDKDGYRDDDGCPDLDHDEDGINEPKDKCPRDPEDVDGFQDEDGCPDTDNDKDGICDPWVQEQGLSEKYAKVCKGSDQCPDEAEDKDKFEDEDGCPDPDNDKDGVPDIRDKCPNEPETLNGYQDEDGCPDKGPLLVVVTDTQIEIKQQIQFKTDSDVIVGDKSFQILDIVAQVLVGNTKVRVSIDGHTDDKGSASYNRELSLRRAEAVKRYLVSKRVAEDRLETQGYGPDRPIAPNKTKKGRAMNRRVEFNILNPPPTAAPEPDMKFDEEETEKPAESAQPANPDMTFTEDESKTK